MKRSLLALFFILGCLPFVFADWRWIGPAAGTIEELRPDRSNPSLWFAVNNGSMYRSTDGGQSWNPTGLRNVGHQVDGFNHGSSVTVTPGGAQVLALASGPGRTTRIFASQDHGRTFQLLAAVPFVMTKIVSHPDNARILYGAALYQWGIVASADAGRHWSAFTNLPLPQQPHPGCGDPYTDVADVAVSPFHPDTIYVSGTVFFRCGPESDEEDFFMQSTDAGKSWKPALHGAGVTFHMDPYYPDRLFARNYSRLLVLTRQGWQEISTQQHLQELFSVPRHENELLALTSGIHMQPTRSTDSGRTWHDIQLDLHNRLRTLAATDDPNRGLLGGTDGGGLYFRDEKHAWTAANSGFRDSVVNDLQGSAASLYALGDAEFLFSAQGSGWRNLTFGIPGASAFAMAVDPGNANRIVVLSTAMEVSGDGGAHWTRATLDGNHLTIGRTITYDPSHSNIIYAAKNNSYGLFKSTDGGVTFKTLSPKFTSRGYSDITRIVIDPNDNRVVYFVARYFGIYKSTNGGASVSLAVNGIAPPCPQCESNPAIDLVPLAAKDTYLGISTQGKIYRTTNGAQQWNLAGQGPAKKWVSRLYTADGMGQHLYCIAGQSPKLYESLNGGATWRNLTNEFGPQSEVYAITDPKQVPLFAGTNHGVFVRQ